jgi:hypothetical protein
MGYVFIRQGKPAELAHETVARRYNFTEGKMVINSDDDALKMKNILVGFYGCKMVPLEVYEHQLQLEQERQARESQGKDE